MLNLLYFGGFKKPHQTSVTGSLVGGNFGSQQVVPVQLGHEKNLVGWVILGDKILPNHTGKKQTTKGIPVNQPGFNAKYRKVFRVERYPETSGDPCCNLFHSFTHELDNPGDQLSEETLDIQSYLLVFDRYIFWGPVIPNLSFGGPGCL